MTSLTDHLDRWIVLAVYKRTGALSDELKVRRQVLNEVLLKTRGITIDQLKTPIMNEMEEGIST